MIQTTRSTSIQSFCTKLLIRCHHHHVSPNPFTLLDTPLLREPTCLPPLALILYSDRTVRYRPQHLVPEPGSESSQTISEIQLSQEVTCEEVEQILAKKKPFTAGARDKLPNGFLRALGPRFCQALAILTSTCWKLEYFPERFKSAKTVFLRKPGKGTYNQAKAWHPIALLNTTGKLMEAIAAARLSKIAEEAGLLPDIQMGFRKGRSTEAALFLLTSQVEKV